MPRLRSVHTGAIVNVSDKRAQQLDGYMPVGDPPPSRTEPKSVWVAYAESLGYDIEGLTKAELIERFS